MMLMNDAYRLLVSCHVFIVGARVCCSVLCLWQLFVGEFEDDKKDII